MQAPQCHRSSAVWIGCSSIKTYNLPIPLTLALPSRTGQKSLGKDLWDLGYQVAAGNTNIIRSIIPVFETVNRQASDREICDSLL